MSQFVGVSMKVPESGVPLDHEQLTLYIAVTMAADSKRAPILRGKNAPIDPTERDRLRGEFASWLAKRMLSGNLVVTLGPSSSYGEFPRTRPQSCCPVGEIHGHA